MEPQVIVSQPVISKRIYPTINITLIQDPSRLLVIPILGWLLKTISLIPQCIIELPLLYLAWSIVLTTNSLVILLTGRYWKFAYNFNLGLMRFTTKTFFFAYGLTNKYPGFRFTINDNYSVEISYPEHPNRWLAFPLLGILVRWLLMVPVLIWVNIVYGAATIGFFIIAWVPIVFTKKYPESIFELTVDQMRLQLAIMAYISGLSDTYPTLRISFHHPVKKVILLLAGLIFLTGPVSGTTSSSRKTSKPLPIAPINLPK